MLDEVEISPVLHKSDWCGSQFVRGGEVPGGVGSWVIVSEFSDAWGKRGEGGQGREVQLT